MKRIRVTCAIIICDRKILVTQRSENMKLPLKWEFPGGKIEIGETEEECIKREIKEEINIEIELVRRLQPNIHRYPDFEIELLPFIANYISGNIFLKEHKRYLYLDIEELEKLDWAEADLPIIKEFKSVLKC